MLKEPLVLILAYVIHGLHGIYIGPQHAGVNPFNTNPLLGDKMYMPRPFQRIMKMPGIGLIIPRFVRPKIPQPRFAIGRRLRDYHPSLMARSELTALEDQPETLSLEMMRQTAPFKKMDAFGNVIIFEGRDGERVLYRPPTEKLLVNSYYVPYYNRYLAAEYMMRLQRLRAYANNYNYLTSRFLNGLYSYPYDDQIRRRLY